MHLSERDQDSGTDRKSQNGKVCTRSIPTREKTDEKKEEKIAWCECACAWKCITINVPSITFIFAEKCTKKSIHSTSIHTTKVHAKYVK